MGALVTSLARLDEKEENARLALILDVESILREALPSRFKSGEEFTHLPGRSSCLRVSGAVRRRLQRGAPANRDRTDPVGSAICGHQNRQRGVGAAEGFIAGSAHAPESP